MRLLLDTHTFLWFVSDDPHLSIAARTVIEDAANERLLSAASHWEMAIKISLGKLTLADPFHVFMPRELGVNRIELLRIELRHSMHVAALPFPSNNHRDPFDRLIISQAIVDGLPIVSADGKFDDYPVTRIW
jgi:PIN domain nuclease of toxin-antitoxin system